VLSLRSVKCSLCAHVPATVRGHHSAFRTSQLAQHRPLPAYLPTTNATPAPTSTPAPIQPPHRIFRSPVALLSYHPNPTHDSGAPEEVFDHLQRHGRIPVGYPPNPGGYLTTEGESPEVTSSLSVTHGLGGPPWRMKIGQRIRAPGRPLLRGEGRRRVDRISDLRVCRDGGTFSTYVRHIRGMRLGWSRRGGQLNRPL
jgi:hypothetical protein